MVDQLIDLVLDSTNPYITAQAALALADNDAERREAERVLEAVRKAEAAMAGRSAPVAAASPSSTGLSSPGAGALTKACDARHERACG